MKTGVENKRIIFSQKEVWKMTYLPSDTIQLVNKIRAADIPLVKSLYLQMNTKQTRANQWVSCKSQDRRTN